MTPGIRLVNPHMTATYPRYLMETSGARPASHDAFHSIRYTSTPPQPTETEMYANRDAFFSSQVQQPRASEPGTMVQSYTAFPAIDATPQAYFPRVPLNLSAITNSSCSDYFLDQSEEYSSMLAAQETSSGSQSSTASPEEENMYSTRPAQNQSPLIPAAPSTGSSSASLTHYVGEHPFGCYGKEDAGQLSFAVAAAAMASNYCPGFFASPYAPYDPSSVSTSSAESAAYFSRFHAQGDGGLLFFPANNNSLTMPSFGATGMSSMMEEQSRSANPVDIGELEAFAEKFKQRRIKLGVTQADVGRALGRMKLSGVGSLSQSTICRFESLTLSHNNMIALKPILQTWLEDAESQAALQMQGLSTPFVDYSSAPVAKRSRQMSQPVPQFTPLEQAAVYDPYPADNSPGSAFGMQKNSSGNENSLDDTMTMLDRKRKRTSITDSEKRSLEAFFSVQPRPSSERISQIADKLNLKKNVVRVWFCNQRQKQKRMKFKQQQQQQHQQQQQQQQQQSSFTGGPDSN